MSVQRGTFAWRGVVPAQSGVEMRSATRTDDRNEFSIPLALLCCRAFCRRTPFGPCALMETPGGEGVLVTEEATWEQFATWPRDARQIGVSRPQRERAAPYQGGARARRPDSRDLPGRPRPERLEPKQPAREPRDLPQIEPRRGGPVRAEPSSHTRIPERSDVDRVIARLGREREADRDGPEIGR